MPLFRLIVVLAAFAAFAPSFGALVSDKGLSQGSNPEVKAARLPASARDLTPVGADAAGFTQPPLPFNPLAPPIDDGEDAPPDFGEIKEGGSTGPTGQEINCDLPPALRMKNIGGKDGSGLCVFTSVMHAARYQNEKRLWNFQSDMKKENGGGYPSKLDAMIERYGKGTRYIQHEGGDLEFLYQAIKSGRMVSITYDGRDMHYGPRTRIAHMTNLVHLDPPEASPRWAAVLDNNFIGDNEIVWLTVDDLKSRWLGNQGGWAVVLLAPRAPLAPRN